MIKALILDMGGVLLDFDFKRCFESFETKAGCYDIVEYIDSRHPKGFIRDLESGKITEEEFYEEALKHCRPGTTPEIFAQCMVDFLDGVDPDKIQMLKDFHERGDIKLYMLSNNNPIVMRYVRKYFSEAGAPVDEIFDRLFLSYEMKMEKPSEAIFRETLRRIGIRPEEALFVDDSSRNTTAAAEIGINTVLYVQRTDLRKAINDALDALK